MGETGKDRGKKENYGCYIREWPCFGKYTWEYTGVKGSHVHNLLSKVQKNTED